MSKIIKLQLTQYEEIVLMRRWFKWYLVRSPGQASLIKWRKQS